jgi:hypothetical protein
VKLVRALALPALLGVAALAHAASGISLQEASYRTGKARILARYQHDLAACNGLGSAQARTVCAAGARMQRDEARKTLKDELAPRGLAHYVAQMGVPAAARAPAAKQTATVAAAAAPREPAALTHDVVALKADDVTN